MAERADGLASWSPEQKAQGERWVETWRRAGPELERIRRDELRRSDAFQSVALLLGPANYREPPRAPKPTSGLVEQQRLFRKLSGR